MWSRFNEPSTFYLSTGEEGTGRSGTIGKAILLVKTNSFVNLFLATVFLTYFSFSNPCVFTKSETLTLEIPLKHTILINILVQKYFRNNEMFQGITVSSHPHTFYESL